MDSVKAASGLSYVEMGRKMSGTSANTDAFYFMKKAVDPGILQLDAFARAAGQSLTGLFHFFLGLTPTEASSPSEPLAIETVRNWMEAVKVASGLSYEELGRGMSGMSGTSANTDAFYFMKKSVDPGILQLDAFARAAGQSLTGLFRVLELHFAGRAGEA